jgi:hypothetical protein
MKEKMINELNVGNIIYNTTGDAYVVVGVHLGENSVYHLYNEENDYLWTLTAKQLVKKKWSIINKAAIPLKIELLQKSLIETKDEVIMIDAEILRLKELLSE